MEGLWTSNCGGEAYELMEGLEDGGSERGDGQTSVEAKEERTFRSLQRTEIVPVHSLDGLALVECEYLYIY